MNKPQHFNRILTRRDIFRATAISMVIAPVSQAAVPVNFQIRAVESAPILNAFNSVTAAIGDAFDRDKDSLRFPRAIRQAIMEDLTEIRSGMLAVIHNRTGIHEGRREDVPKVLPDLRTVRGLMKSDEASVSALTRYRDRVAPILPTVGAKELAEPDMVSGHDLPRLLQDAIAVVIPELRRISPSASLAATDVVLIRDLARFGGTLGLAIPLNGLSEKIRMFVIDSRLPIYVIEERPDMLAALTLYERGEDQYLRYAFAAMLGHEWQHTLPSDNGDVRAYAFELELLQRYFAKGFLPPECADYVEKVNRRVLEAQRAEITGEDQSLKLLLKNR